jgi:hypothetical protein
MYMDATVIGLNLYAEGTVYAIHDDVWGEEEPYTNSYYNCRVVGRYLLNANCIGGGVGKYSRHIIENCYFDNGCENSLTVRYHNNTFPDSYGDIWISNSYFNSNLAFCYYGPESNHIDAYVTNCELQSIIMKFETPDFPYPNITLY